MEDLRVRDLMTSGVFAVLPDDDLLELSDLMRGWQVRHAPVVDESAAVVGIVSLRDLLRETSLGRKGVAEEEQREELARLRVKNVMSVHVEVVTPDESIAASARRIFEGKLGCLVVVDERMRLQGILTESDFVRHLSASAEPLPAR